MQNESKGKIFLAADRGHTENELFRSLQTFCFGNYNNQHKCAFGPLYVLNDDTLAGGQALKYLIEEDTVVVVLPLVGGISFHAGVTTFYAQAGESIVSHIPKGTTFEIANPFADQLVNYIQLWFKLSPDSSQHNSITSFEINKNRNSLVDAFSIFGSGEKIISAVIGKFGGRKEAVYKPFSQKNGVFVLAIQGAFEVQNRLLENRDSLALWNVEEIDMEALSEDAIILIVELPHTDNT